MSDDPSQELERRKVETAAKWALWASRAETYRHTDRAQVDVGLAALKTAIFINAGATVALLSFVAAFWKSELLVHSLFEAMEIFVYGVGTGAVAVGLAYFYQVTITATAMHSWIQSSAAGKNLPDQIPATVIGSWLWRVVVAFAFMSYVNFIWGAFVAMRALER